jgi:hypothetical protein
MKQMETLCDGKGCERREGRSQAASCKWFGLGRGRTGEEAVKSFTELAG